MSNDTLKAVGHSLYDPTRADWSSTNGWARFGGLATIDNQLPGKIVLPSRIYYVGFIIARAHAYVVFPPSAYIYAGFWQNGTSGLSGSDSYWISGANPFALAGSVNGTVATPTDRKYKVFARTDRATSFLSAELDKAAAPSNTDFANGASVSLSWTRLTNIGIISYDVYRNTGGVYELLEQVESGANTYLDNNSSLSGASGYPTATDDKSIALTTTRTNTTESVLNNLFIDGVSNQWSTLAFPIPIPNGYNVGAVPVVGDYGLQWLRIGIGGISDNPDLRLPGCVVVGTTVTSELGLFTADQVGLTIELSRDVGGGVTTTVATFIDSDHITITAAPPADDTYTAYITAGAGDHCLLIDCVHCGFGDGATFSNNPSDLTPPRPQFPLAAPNGSNQGGTGQGGSPTNGGQPRCIEENEMVLTYFGNAIIPKRAGDLKVGDVLESGNLNVNVVATPPQKYPCKDLWELETENGCSLIGSPTHPVYRNRMDQSGTEMQLLTPRHQVLTCVNGAYVPSNVVKCEATGRSGNVVKIACTPTPSFVAGSCGQGFGGLTSHNRKPDDQGFAPPDLPA